jgi:gamma-glutamyl-gamma-aminobutyrate hydrolase PuuD
MVRVALPFGISTPENKRGNYRRALLGAGIEPMEDRASLAGTAGLLLAGGGDIDPAHYGEARAPQTEESDVVRDLLETALLREALERDLPVLGICRGLQLLNVLLGGTLIQHIGGHDRPRVRDAHTVSVAPGSRLQSILGTAEYLVNTGHHQCIGRVADGLVVTATSPDDIVEAVEMPEKRFVLAVQWHPEARLDGADARLFAAFREGLG